MSAFLTALAAWWVHWGPWIGASLIPTIITGLSLAPKLAPEAAWIQKAWDIVKTAMGYLSVVTPKDVPGTFQLPLKLNKVLKKPAGPAAGLILVIFFSSSQMSCAWTKHEATVVSNNIIDCAKAEKDVIDNSQQSLIVTIIKIGMQIMQTESQGTDALEQLAINLIKQYGEPIVACVFDKMKPSVDKPTLDSSDMALMATISNRGWKFKGE